MPCWDNTPDLIQYRVNKLTLKGNSREKILISYPWKSE